MCAAQNLTAFSYWPTSEHPNPENGVQSYPNPSFLQDNKSKFFRHPMFFLNNITKQELTSEYDKNVVAEMQHRHFLAPLTAPEFPQTNHEPIVKPAEVLSSENRMKEESVKSPGRDSTGKVRPYVCDDCGKSFLLKHHLTTHARTHTGIKPHVCTHCGKSFTHKHCLNTHLLLHSSDRPYQCEECKKSFTLKHHLLTHSRVHSREKPFVCTECGQAFPLKRHLITHSKFHAGERPYICDDCGESFAQKDHLVMHSRFHGFLNSFVCSDCGATFSRKFELVNHNKLHGKEPYSCPLCSKEFLQKRTLATHIRLHSVQSPYACTNCGESFQTPQELISHSKTHTSNSSNTQSKSLVCQECGCVFNSVEALALHIKLHTGDASLVTDLCTLTSSLQHSTFTLNTNHHHHNHNNNSPLPVKQKNHICEHCSKAFSAKHGLYQHHKKHPNGACALRSHVCEVCNKAFFQKNHLLLHQRQHMDPSEKNNSSANGRLLQLHGSSASRNASTKETSNNNPQNNGVSDASSCSNKIVEVPKFPGSSFEEARNGVISENFRHISYQYEQRECGNSSREMQDRQEMQERREIQGAVGNGQDCQMGLSGDGKVIERTDKYTNTSAPSEEKLHTGVICNVNHKD